MSKDQIPTLKDAKNAIKGNGLTLDTKERLIDVTEFMNEFKSEGLKSMAESVVSLVNAARTGKANLDQVKIQLAGYKMLIELRMLDTRVKG